MESRHRCGHVKCNWTGLQSDGACPECGSPTIHEILVEIGPYDPPLDLAGRIVDPRRRTLIESGEYRLGYNESCYDDGSGYMWIESAQDFERAKAAQVD